MDRPGNETIAVEHAIRVLRKNIPGLRRVRRDVRKQKILFDFLAEAERTSLVFEVKYLPQLRARDLIGQLAAGALQARRCGEILNSKPVVIVVTPKAGRATIVEAEEFMEQYLPDVAWGVLDLRGSVRLQLKAFDIDVDNPYVPGPRPGEERRPRLSFSDLNRWMMKILLLADAPEKYWGGPRKAFFTPAQFRHPANVSVDKAYKFLRMLKGNDFLRQTANGLMLVRKAELVEHWLADERLRPARRLAVRSILGRKPALASLAPPEQEPVRSAVGGFTACKLLGVSNTTVESLELHVVGDINEFLKEHDLEPCREHDADLFVLVSGHPESVFRGVVRQKSARVVDVFQAALDVVPNPARGLEQAQYIIGQILG